MEAIGPVLIVVSIPLILRWVPRNRFFGLRIPATNGDEAVWYDVNAMHGRHLFVLGMLMVALDFVLPTATRTMVLAATGWLGFVGILVADWRTGNRLRRERAAR